MDKNIKKHSTKKLESDIVYEISCNIDDMSGEEIGYAMDSLLECGALDVYLIPIQMKKNRPGVIFNVLCKESDKEQMIKNVLTYTSTRGVRYQSFERTKLFSEFEKISIDDFEIRNKISYAEDIYKEKLEFDDIKKYAMEKKISYKEALAIIREKL